MIQFHWRAIQTEQGTMMPLKPHPTDPDKMVFVSHKYEGQLMKTPEDEEFERIEREQKRIKGEMKFLSQELRNAVLEEVAQEIEKFKGFGEDTIASFAIHIRNMKR